MPTTSGPTAQRGSSSPVAQPRSQPAPAPRAAQPSTPSPRYEAPSTRYEQPSAPQPGASRYEQPAPSRYETPSSSRTGSGRDSGSRSDTGPSTGRPEAPGTRTDSGGTPPTYDRSGRIVPAGTERNSPTPYEPRIWQPDAVVDLSGAVRTPRAGVPSISGTRSGPEGGLASGRLARAGLDGSRPAAALPHPSTSADSLRSRYGSSEGQPGGSRAITPTTRDGQGTGLSSGRTRSASGRTSSAPTRQGDAGARTGEKPGRTIDGEPGRKTDSPARGADVDARVAKARARAKDIDKTDPANGHRLRAAAKAANTAITVGTGVVIGTGVGFYGGYGYPCDYGWNNCGWYWNSCWYGGWWWGYGWCWPYYGSCWWGFPSYGNACYPWGYGGSYWGYAYPEVITTTVIYEQPEPQVVPEPEPAPGINAPAPGAEAKVAPEVRAALEGSADEALAAGDAAFREGRYSDAVRHYARAVEYSPERGSLWLILSDALFATGDYHYAAFSLRRALEVDATLLEPLVDKHSWYADPADFDRHIAWAESYLRDHVLDEDARLILAANYLFAKRFASASDSLESAFGAGILETTAGKLVLERSRRALGVTVR